MTLYMVAWTGGLETPDFKLFDKKGPAKDHATMCESMSEEPDRVDVIQIDQETLEIKLI